MERNCNRRAHVNIVAYARALWAATKKKRRYTAIAILIPMVLVEMLFSAFRGFGSPTGSHGSGSVIYAIYPIFIIACCITASFGMSSKEQIPVRRVPVWGEWTVRWVIFVFLPFLFFLFISHALDGFIATPTYQPAPWEVGLEPFPGSYTLPFVFFIMSFFFAVSVYFPFLSFFAGVLILCIVGIISLIFIPRAVFWYGGMEDTSWEVIVFLLAMGVLALTLSYYRLKCYRTDDFE